MDCWVELDNRALISRTNSVVMNVIWRRRKGPSLTDWIVEGITPWDKGVRTVVLLIMAVVQPTKNKVWPLLDYRELNKYITCHSGGDAIEVCRETLRKWSQMTEASKAVDLKFAYLQIYVARHLWKNQEVIYKEQPCYLNRLGSGLNITPKIMSAILKAVLKKGW